MKKILFFAVLISLSALSRAQVIENRIPEGGSSYQPSQHDELSQVQRSQIISTLQKNVVELQIRGILPKNTEILQPLVTQFNWPIKQAAGFTDPGYYGISNYIDQNLAYPNQLLDYDCGNRTYDLSSGYNHKGTDIFSWPYPWLKMNTNAVEVIAGAPGIIIGKDDGNFDQNCSFCSSACNWNAVYIQHTDGSIAWYGHLKSGTLTTKTVGASVTSGEYLGIMGSSGNSTGPHLHFEVYTNGSYTQLVDPWNGACNSLNPGVSWWATQQPYRVSTLNTTMTHATPPQLGNCPSGENANSQTSFASGNTVYLSSYYRDQLSGQTATHTVYRPDNSVFAQWNQNFTISYNASWWYYSIILPANATTGVWRYQIQYNGSGQTISTNFGVNTTLPLDLLQFTASKKNKQVLVEWKTDNEINVNNYTVEKSNNAITFTSLATVAAKNLAGIQLYQLTDDKPFNGVNYYRLKSSDNDGKINYSAVVKVQNTDNGLLVDIFPVPAKNVVNIQVFKKVNLHIDIYNASGQLIQQANKNFQSGEIFGLNTTSLADGVYYIQITDGQQVLERRKIFIAK
jgi:murein DD-endopeptidase MepM/ murein hydrolase activator NlpD